MEYVQGFEYGCKIRENVGRGCGAFGGSSGLSGNAASYGVTSFLGNATLSGGTTYADNVAASDVALSSLAIPSGAAALSGAGAHREGLWWSDQHAVWTCGGIMISELGPLTVTIAIEILMALLACAMRIFKRLWQQHVPTPFTLGIFLRCHGR